MSVITELWRGQPGKYFCISTKKDGSWADHFFNRISLHEADRFIREHGDHDLYFCPHGFTRRRRLAKYAVEPNILWADIDAVKPKIKPTICIESSPGRLAGVWMVDRFDIETNQKLTYYLGADKGGWDFTQVLRIPDTINYKYETRPKTKLLWDDGPRYKLSDIVTRMANGHDKDPVANDAAAVYKKYEKAIPAWCRRELLNGKPVVGTRSEMLWRIEQTLRESGLTSSESFVLIKASAWNKFEGRDEQLRKELDKGIGKHLNGKKVEFVGHNIMSIDQIEPENLDWVWYPYLARGEVTIVEGDPDAGKSYFIEAVSIALCDGKPLPGEGKRRSVNGKVLLYDVENDPNRVLKKRLTENGLVNESNFYCHPMPFSMGDDDELEKVHVDFDLIKPVIGIFDTVNTYVGGTDTHKASESQQMMIKFKVLAREHNCAIVVLRHLTKGTRDRAMYRGQGSIAYTGVARVVITVGFLPGDEVTRVACVTKLNIARKPRALTFKIESLPDRADMTDRSQFSWGEYVDNITSEDITLPYKAEASGDKGAAQDLLRGLLKNGPVEIKKILRTAEAKGISKTTLHRASTELKVVKTRDRAERGVSYWTLP